MKIEILYYDVFRFKQFDIDFHPVKITKGLIFKTSITCYPVDKCYVSNINRNPLCVVYANTDTGENLDKETCMKIHNLMEINYKTKN